MQDYLLLRLPEVYERSIVVEGETSVIGVIFVEEVCLIDTAKLLRLNCAYAVDSGCSQEHIIMLLFLSTVDGLHVHPLALLFDGQLHLFDVLLGHRFLVRARHRSELRDLLWLIILFLQALLQIAPGLRDFVFEHHIVQAICQGTLHLLQLLLLFLLCL